MSSSEIEPNSGAETAALWQNRLLAIDGGGIRGLISIEILLKMERELAEMYFPVNSEAQQNFRLCHYFNFIGGTSVGSIIAAMLSVGYSMEEVKNTFDECSDDMFPTNWGLFARRKYRAGPLGNRLRTIFSYLSESEKVDGETERNPIVMGDPQNVKTLLMIMLRNATTGSNWPLTNNPAAKYNDLKKNYSNLHFPLWQLVRASTAAPAYFPVERLRVNDEEPFEFVDGGVSPHNNPAFQMFLHAVLPEFRIEMATGRKQMLIVSVGTGNDTIEHNIGEVGEMLMLDSALFTVKTMMHSATEYQDILCRVYGDYVVGEDKIDSELGSLASKQGDDNEAAFTHRDKKLFTYVRYNPKLTKDHADQFNRLHRGLVWPVKKKPFDLDALRAAELFSDVGRGYAEEVVSAKHFQDFCGNLCLGRQIVNRKGDLVSLPYRFGDKEVLEENVKESLSPTREENRWWHPRAALPLAVGAAALALPEFLRVPWTGFPLRLVLGPAGLLAGAALLYSPRGRTVWTGVIFGIILLLISLPARNFDFLPIIEQIIRWLGLVFVGSALVSLCLGRSIDFEKLKFWKRDGQAEKSPTPADPAPQQEASPQISSEPTNPEIQSTSVNPETVMPVAAATESNSTPPEPNPSQNAITKTTSPGPDQDASRTDLEGKGQSRQEDESERAVFAAGEIDPDLAMELEAGVEITFHRIPAGSFYMGSQHGQEEERPVHAVTIEDDFLMGTIPITQEQFAAWTKRNLPGHKNSFPGNPRRPAENMTWQDATDFCDWLTRRFPPEMNLIASLPDEARWEYACRAGGASDRSSIPEYYSGNGAAALEKVGWFRENSDEQSHPVGKLGANRWGLHDIHGNVWEWCCNAFDPESYEDRSRTAPDWTSLASDPETAALRAIRGGSWINSAEYCRSSRRKGCPPEDSSSFLGFRVCLLTGR